MVVMGHDLDTTMMKGHSLYLDIIILYGEFNRFGWIRGQRQGDGKGAGARRGLQKAFLTEVSKIVNICIPISNLSEWNLQ